MLSSYALEIGPTETNFCSKRVFPTFKKNETPRSTSACAVSFSSEKGSSSSNSEHFHFSVREKGESKTETRRRCEHIMLFFWEHSGAKWLLFKFTPTYWTVYITDPIFPVTFLFHFCLFWGKKRAFFFSTGLLPLPCI